MASISFRTAAKTAAVAGALGLVASFGAPAASAQSTDADGNMDFGSLVSVFNVEAIGGSVQGSIEDTEGPGSAASLGPAFTPASVDLAFGSAANGPGSIGELVGLVNNNEDTQGSIAGSVSDSLTGEGESPLGSIDSDSLDLFFNETVGNITPAG